MKPIFLSSAHIIRVHDEAIKLGGLMDLRDSNALESIAIAPETFLRDQPETNIWTLAAILFEKLVHSYVFSDANKRTAFMSMHSFLRMNGKHFHCDKETALNLVVKIATHEMKRTDLIHFLMKNAK